MASARNEALRQKWIEAGRPTLKEFAEMVGLSYDTVRKASAKGKWLQRDEVLKMHEVLVGLAEDFVLDVKAKRIKCQSEEEYKRIFAMFEVMKAIGGNVNGEVERK
ncbi:hypothetical protein [uncultured Clostridium sp.]|uniref:hypothetical protein n=1 Tax=uncultured Clostridium sp. TaxID=59620 RepID=UPI002615DFEE|nr:hypothetical protein [uncultured Clostridium sp.]